MPEPAVTPAVPPAEVPPAVTDLRAGRRRDGAPWADSATPVLSWRTATTAPGWDQASATLTVTRPDRDGAPESVELSGPDCVCVPWPFAPLRSRERVLLEVATTGTDGVPAAPARVEVEAPLLDGADWSARSISLPAAADDTPGQLRTHLTVEEVPVRARLYVTALGSYEVEVNGVRVGDEVLAPGWTSYRDRVLVQTHDVTGLLRPGANTVGAWLAGAWFTERYGFFGRATRAYEGPAAFLAQLELTYADGRRQVVATGPGWEGSTAGPLRSSGIYAGEEFDATRHDPAWSTPSGRAGGWAPAVVTDLDPAVLSPAAAEPVRRVQEVAPVAVTSSPSGATVVDFGQNLVGRVRIRVRGPRGHTVTLRHAEVLEDGELAIRQLRYAWSVDRYTLAGDGEETWEPRFTFHGFRYVQVDDWPGALDPADVTAVVCSSDTRRTGRFTSSSPLLDRLHENVVWSTRGNFLSLPTDCPQRDERLGWTGDLQVFAGAAATLVDCDAFLASWLADLALEQRRNGGVVPIIVPTAMAEDTDGVVAAWGDAATVVPWTLYERFGDRDLLARQYPSMRSWADVELAQADDDGLWTRGYQLGDWLDPRAPADRPREGRTHPSLVASAYLFRSLDLVARTAAVLGRDEDARRYAGLAERTRTAFLGTYVTPRGRMVSEGPTTYALALVFGLAPDPDLRAALGRRLAEIVREDGYRIGTGFVGTPLVMDALCATGQTSAAGRLLQQTESPSWLYPVTVGATTVWERWDALLPDGTVNPHEMTSFNHYAFGAVVDWLHRGLAGLAPAEPGYRRIAVAPTVLDGLTAARSELLTPYGPAAAGWVLDGDEVTVRAVVPPGTTADVVLPDGSTDSVGSGEHVWTSRWSPPRPRTVLAGLDTDLAHLVDDPAALARVREVLAVHDPGRARAFDGGLRYEAGSTLRTALLFADPAALAAVEEALTGLTARR
ncbi:glycoside hydrolase family 78 protein [Geodermatophilus aquaeductus]|uniref:alpha-L-rhamnosidase n=1 Tax=Geodermatophilus aquaeductus TaxID=1564161 RepID=A0A521E873_9ACTN|nr:alpha-L-rhamnosidase [Geodermatophilus aquaeductus]SMO80124.1 alpha-L-rhamnosidase [Geodermatophilus aquaeductus]